MKPLNSAPITSSGMLPGLTPSIMMPSSPIRLTASVPSTRSRIPPRTSLNDTPLLPLLHLREPLLELVDFRIAAAGSAQPIELCPHIGIARLALKDRLVNLASFVVGALLRVEIGHGDGVRDIRLDVRQCGRRLGCERRRLDPDAHQLLDRYRSRCEIAHRLFERAFGMPGEHRLTVSGRVAGAGVTENLVAAAGQRPL